MKSIAIFKDGKGARGQKAKLVKRGNKRVLIEFVAYNYDKDEDITVIRWFNLYIPSYVRYKKRYKHNNKRNFARYCHGNSNMFYSDENQTEGYKEKSKDWFTKEYHEELFGK